MKNIPILSQGKRLVIKALEDSYYPNLNLLINADKMVEIIDSDPTIAALYELLTSLHEAVEMCGCSIKERLSGHLIECRAPQWIEIIEQVEGNL